MLIFGGKRSKLDRPGGSAPWKARLAKFWGFGSGDLSVLPPTVWAIE
ncbi:hypothetical protein [Alloactinosynnema sp. L-07]|nr:hypothetical protein [Alloactinosynnema sp. L-07]